ncbi:uncharacterized protein PG986_009743 [Apiospora aurea]|uniref:Uncharacterized protein n=1 Tax=Apiospora aurea TaxID=335848 RepID=A0ABR1Q8I0_9PEZI
MTPRCKYLATDIIGHLAFGHALATQTDEALRLIPRAFAGLNPVVYLSRYSAVYARLANEIRTTFSSGSDIRQGPLLASCKYLRAVIDETLRICPPTPRVMWREKDPLSPEPLVVDGDIIPPGTLAGVGTYSLMHNPEYFPEPFSFRAQRWLDEAVEEEDPKAKEARAIMRRAFIPFSLGDRGCAGKALAYSEMSPTVTKTLCFMADHNGPNLVFRAREDYWEDLVKTS